MLSAIQTFAPRYPSVRFVMAPMSGITDTVFRLLIRELGAQVVISELLSAEGLVRGGERTKLMMNYDERERPIGIQIFGSKIDTMVNAAKIVEQSGVDFVDINFGCPVKKVVCDGAGAAWLKDPTTLGKLCYAVRRSIKIPLAIKVRTGWDESSIRTEEVVRVAAEAGVEWVAIHGRTRSQGYSGQADWNHIREISQKSSIPIIGNGDILSSEDALQKIHNSYSHAVMIGRGALKNPWIFGQILGQNPGNFSNLVERHFDIAIEKKDRTRAFLSLKKFMAWYATGLPGASVFRSRMFTSSDVTTLKTSALDYFRSVEGFERQADPKPFLMGGHG